MERILKKAKWAYSKIRRYGVYKSCQIAATRLYCAWQLKRAWFLKIKFYSNLMKLIFIPRYRQKRILGIWDFKVLPWSIGDPLVFIEALSTLKIEKNADQVDVCIIYDAQDPAGIRRDDSNITADNAQDYMLEFLPLFSMCPYLGSVYQFNSRRELYYFLKSNIERYDIFPPLAKHLGETYNYYGGAPDVSRIQKFFKDYRYIPHLRIGDRDERWARWFYLNNLKKAAIPVTLSLKQTTQHVIRNADPRAWLAFIDQCKTHYPEVVFVVVGLRGEIFDGLRERTNVIISKDFGTSVIEDLALIRASFIYMGTNSGVNTIAWFSDLPYLLFQWPVHTLHIYGLRSDENFNFANDEQNIFSSDILTTPELLFDEFKKLYSRLDKEKWFNTTRERASNKMAHPAAVIIEAQNESFTKENTC